MTAVQPLERVPDVHMSTEAELAEADDAEELRTALATERQQRIWSIVAIGAPTAAAMTTVFLSQSVVMYFVSQRLGPESLAQLSVAVLTYNVVGLSLGMGLCSALETLAPQAFGRDSNTTEFSLLFMRSAIICLLFFPIPAVLFLFSEGPLSALFGAELGHGAATYLRIGMWSLPAAWGMRSVSILLVSQHLSQLSLAASVGALLCTPVLGYFMIGESVATASLMMVCRDWVAFGLAFALAWFHPASLLRRGDWRASEAMHGLKAQLRLGVSCATGVCADWWAFEMLQILASRLGATSIAAYTILVNVNLVALSLSIGAVSGFGTVLGNLLGENRPVEAKWLVSVIHRGTAAIGLVSFAAIYLGGPLVFHFYTADAGLLAALSQGSLGFALMGGLDATQLTLSSLYRGTGRQAINAKAGVVTLWLLGLPTAAVLALCTPLALGGIGCGQAMALVVLLLMQWFFARRFDWDALALEASRGPQKEAQLEMKTVETEDQADEGAPLESKTDEVAF